MTDRTTTGLALLATLITALLAPLRLATAQALTDEQTARRADIAQFRAEFLAPDIAAPWSLHAYRRDLDPAMEAVAAALQRGV